MIYILLMVFLFQIIQIGMFLFFRFSCKNLNIRYILKNWCSTILGREKLEKRQPEDVSDSMLTVRWWKHCQQPNGTVWYSETTCGFPNYVVWTKDLCFTTLVCAYLDCGLILTFKICLSLMSLLWNVCMMSLFGQVPRHVYRVE